MHDSPWTITLALCLFAVAARAQDSVTLVQSAPSETGLLAADLPEAHEVWREMFDGAARRIDLMQFYLSDEPGGESRLTPVVNALVSAAARGVQVRILVEKEMIGVYPELPLAFGALLNFEIRPYDVHARTGGILHAKLILVDDEAFLGSQNFDWRSLEHILEAGVRIRDASLVRDLDRLFEHDWRLMGPDRSEEVPSPRPPTEAERKRARSRPYSIVAAPAALNPDGFPFSVDELRFLLDGSKETVEFQLLHYSPRYEGEGLAASVDAALRRAADRGVQVRMVVSDWNLDPEDLPGLKSLQAVPNVDVRIAHIPEHSEGFIPYARVIHSKLLVVDGKVAWVGTSNWAEDYFAASRGIELVIREKKKAREVREIFLMLWKSPYVTELDPAKDYQKPRIR